MLFSSRRVDMRWAAVPLSRGIGRPSAGTNDVDEEFAGWEKRGGKAKGRECLRDLGGRCEGGGRGLATPAAVDAVFGAREGTGSKAG